MPPFLIPVVMWLGHEVFGALEPTTATIIASGLSRLGRSNNLVQDVLDIFKQSGVNVSNEQEQEFKLKLTSLTGNLDIDKIEAQSESTFKSGWRPFIGWGMGFNLVLHYSVVNMIDIVNSIFGTNIHQIPSMDPMALTIISGLLGLYMMSRTHEKINNAN